MLGWLAPIIFILPYDAYRHTYEDIHCWMDLGESNWFLGITVVLILILNFGFLINVIRILRTKVTNSSQHNQDQDNRDNKAAMKQARAILFLVPILGLNFLLFPFRPSANSPLEPAYDVFSAGSSSLQGVCISILLCFTNSEVVNMISMRWAQHQTSHVSELSMMIMATCSGNRGSHI